MIRVLLLLLVSMKLASTRRNRATCDLAVDLPAAVSYSSVQARFLSAFALAFEHKYLHSFVVY